MKVLIIDNFDSFTFNLHHYVCEYVEQCDVVRNDNLESTNIEEYDKIILSPGPSLPSDHPSLLKFLNQFSESKSILGICLGMQAISEYFGAELKNLENVKHGLNSENYILTSDVIFSDVPVRFKIGHYHSWVVNKQFLPECLRVTSENEDGLIMSISHKELDVKGVQFHPESVLTEHGNLIIKNWLLS